MCMSVRRHVKKVKSGGENGSSVSLISVAQGLTSVFIDVDLEEIRTYIHQHDTHTLTLIHSHKRTTSFSALWLFSVYVSAFLYVPIFTHIHDLI